MQYPISAPVNRSCVSNGAAGERRPSVEALVLFGLTCVVTPPPSCGGSDEAETTENPGEISFELSERGDAGVVGVRATLRFETPERTTIIVDGLDEGEPAGGGPNPVRLVRGSCDDPLSVVAELESLQGPVSTTTVDRGLTAREWRMTERRAVVFACRPMSV